MNIQKVIDDIKDSNSNRDVTLDLLIANTINIRVNTKYASMLDPDTIKLNQYEVSYNGSMHRFINEPLYLDSNAIITLKIKD